MILSSKQKDKIQVLRGIAIGAVVMIHCMPIGIIQVFLRPFFNYSVGLFLFLSGLLTSADNYHPRKRIIKVLVPYFFWTVAYTILEQHESFYGMLIKIIYNLITGRSAPIMYYIFVYCELTLLVPLLDKVAHSEYRYLFFAIAPLEIVLMRMIPMVFQFELNSLIRFLMEISCLCLSGYFYLGYLLGNGIIRIDLNIKKVTVLLVTSIVIQILEGYWYYSLGVLNCGTQVKLSALLTGMFACVMAFKYLQSEKTQGVEFLKLLGNHSFGIYFIHLLFVRFFGNIIFPVNSIIVLIVSLFCVYTVNKVLGKYSKIVGFY